MRLPPWTLWLAAVAASLPLAAAEPACHVGAYDAAQWAGLTLTAADAPAGFAFALEIDRGGQRAVGYDIFHIVRRVGANSGDGRYACLEIDPTLPFGRGGETPILDKRQPGPRVRLEWARHGVDGVIGRIRNDSDCALELRFYAPWDYPALYGDAGPGQVSGRCGGHHFRFVSLPAGVAGGNQDQRRLRFAVRRGGDILFAARIAAVPIPSLRLPGSIPACLATARSAYERQRVAVTGANPSLAESIVNNLNWMVLLQPERQALYTPAGRRWIFPAPGDALDHWTIFEWDSFFNALLLAVEAPDLARAAVTAVLGTQYENGCIPNWRGRFGGSPDHAQPPVGAFAVLKLHRQHPDLAFLRRCYPALRRFNLFWTDAGVSGKPRRDGNANGLLEWGSDTDRLAAWRPEWEMEADGRTRAGWESGEDDLPNWDDVPFNEGTGTLELDCVDLNSLFALDCECLAIIAGLLGESDDQQLFHGRRLAVARRMNEDLWDEASGTYRDRFWDGRRSPKLAAANYLPLLAGVPDAARARRLLSSLLDPQLFWGEHVVPTINRRDPAFSDQQYWRGTIWPPTNYLLYQGLRRSGFRGAAADLAARSVRLFLGSWDRFQLCRENYDSRDGSGGGHRYQSWGPLFALCGIEEFIDWPLAGGVDLGSPAAPAQTVLHRLPGEGCRWTVERGPARTRVWRNRSLLLQADGPLALEGLTADETGCRAVSECAAPRRLRFSLHGRGFQVTLDGREWRAPAAVIDLPAGRHEFSIAAVAAGGGGAG